MFDKMVDGRVDSIVFRSPDSDFAIVHISGKNFYRLSVKGNFPVLYEGMEIECTGEYQKHPKYGESFSAELIKAKRPESASSIEAYLSSGLIKGIGKKKAKLIVEHLGTNALEKIKEHPECLLKIPTIGKKKYQAIADSVLKMSAIEEIMMWLLEHGITTKLAYRIYKEFGSSAATMLKANPYILTTMQGIGFKKADEIALRFDIDVHDQRRVEAAIAYAISQNELNGHTLITDGQLRTSLDNLLGSQERESVAQELIDDALKELVTAKKIVRVDLSSDGAGYQKFTTASHEQKIATRLKKLVKSSIRTIDNPEKLLSKAEEITGKKLYAEQRKAVLALANSPVGLLTGGPGVGKTTLLEVLVTMLNLAGLSVSLAAPTGKAARRMAESTSKEAKTLHRLLKTGPGGTFLHNNLDPLDCDALLVDEGSMLDNFLSSSTLSATKSSVRVIIIGDTDQLPSVGPGAILRDLIASKLITHVHLSEVHRQAKGSKIITNAHAINEGRAKDLELGDDFHWEATRKAEETKEVLVSRIKTLINQGYSLSDDIQVLVGTRAGPLGINELNNVLQAEFNPASGKVIKHGDREFRSADKIMLTRNNYDLGEDGVFNGTTGVVKSIGMIDEELSIVAEMEGEGTIVFTGSDFSDLLHSYAMTVHKSQGSEFPIVLMPLDMSQSIMMTRNWLYTGVTRARSQVYLSGSRKALAMAIHTSKENNRQTYLQQRLAA